jgi:acyl-CoA thioesterase
MTTTFDDTTFSIPRAIDTDRCGVDLDTSWVSLDSIHGGYLTAVGVQAAAARVPGQAVRTVTSNFLRPTSAGPAVVDTRVLRAGNSLSTVLADVRQYDRTTATIRATLAAPLRGSTWETESVLEIAPPERCIPFVPPPGAPHHFSQAEALFDPSHVPFGGSTEAIVAGYIRPAEPRPIDAAWLVMALDWFPPAAFARADWSQRPGGDGSAPAGGLSIDYNVHVHRTLTDPMSHEWLGVRLEAEVSKAGLALERGRLSDSAGRLLAESFHTRRTG